MADKKKTAAAESKLPLAEQLAKKREELIEAKRGLVAGELQNPHRLAAIRKDIARLMTKINAEKQASEKKGE